MTEQDRSLWDRSLMHKGFYYLEKSTSQESFSIYHILAAISGYPCGSKDFESTNWNGILSLYDRLIKIDPSPLVLLNRAIVVSKVSGVLEGLAELEKIKDSPTVESYHLFQSTLAEFYTHINEFEKASDYLKKGL